MVSFRLTSTAESTNPEDFRPLALGASVRREIDLAVALTEPTPFAVSETLPGASAIELSGTRWHARILDELRTPKPAGVLGERVLCSSEDREAWLAARRRGITATDAARLATHASVRTIVAEKLQGGNSFSGNAFTDFGRRREPVIAEWMHREHGVRACGLLFRAEHNDRHLATPDGLAQLGDEVVLAEIKTTNKGWKRIPRNYLRQVWWQQYVCGAKRTLFVWEQHENFVVTDAQPRAVWIERDEAEIARLVELADAVLAHLPA